MAASNTSFALLSPPRIGEHIEVPAYQSSLVALKECSDPVIEQSNTPFAAVSSTRRVHKGLPTRDEALIT